MRIQLATRIHVAVVASAVFLVSAVFYSSYLAKRGVMWVTIDTPAFDVRVLLLSIVWYETAYDTLPPDLSSMGPPSTGKEANRASANFIDSRLASGSKNGYVYHYVPSAQSKSFFITADPSGSDSPASRHYFSDQTGVVRFEVGHAATGWSLPYQGD